MPDNSSTRICGYVRGRCHQRSISVHPHQGWLTIPWNLGTTGVGTVAAVGSDVNDFKVGDRVFGLMDVRETNIRTADKIWHLEGDLDPYLALCVEPAVCRISQRARGKRALWRSGRGHWVGRTWTAGGHAWQAFPVQKHLLPLIPCPLPAVRLAQSYGADHVLDPCRTT